MAKVKRHDVVWVSPETHQRLQRWAEWARQLEGVGYAGQSTFERLRGSTVSTGIGCTDEDALVVDRAIATLKRRNQAMGRAVKYYYLGGCQVTRVAQRMRVHRKLADTLIKSGTAWIDSALTALE